MYLYTLDTNRMFHYFLDHSSTQLELYELTSELTCHNLTPVALEYDDVAISRMFSTKTTLHYKISVH